MEEEAELHVEDLPFAGEVLADALREWHGGRLERHGAAGDTCLHVGAGGPSFGGL